MGYWTTGFDGNPLYILSPGEQQPAPCTSTNGVLVDATTQMLAARVEGLEKDINALQFVWGRVKEAESATAHAHARIDELARTMPSASRSVVLLKRALNEISPVSLLARDISEFLRNR